MKPVIGIFALMVALTAGCAPRAAGSPPSPRPIAFGELDALLKSESGRPLLVDVRTEAEYREGHIPGAVLFPYDEIPAGQAEFQALAGSKDRPIVVYCRTGRRSSVAAQSLKSLGYTDIADFGGIGAWRGALE